MIDNSFWWELFWMGVLIFGSWGFVILVGCIALWVQDKRG
jgi:hypothetical protein